MQFMYLNVTQFWFGYQCTVASVTIDFSCMLIVIVRMEEV
jgi:hypothetical protein